MYLCIECEKEYEKLENICQNCGGYLTITNVPEYFRKPEQQFLTAKELRQIRPQAQSLISGYEFLGHVPKKVNIMVHGKAGSGKSSFCLCFANNFPDLTLYISAEEDEDQPSFIRKLEDYQIDSENLICKRLTDKREIIPAIEQLRVRNLVIDSVSEMWIAPNEVKYIKSKVSGNFIFLLHQTKQGTYKGSSDYGHLCDIVLFAQKPLNASFSKIVSEKNRFGAADQEYIFQFPKKREF